MYVCVCVYIYAYYKSLGNLNSGRNKIERVKNVEGGTGEMARG